MQSFRVRTSCSFGCSQGLQQPVKKTENLICLTVKKRMGLTIKIAEITRNRKLCLEFQERATGLSKEVLKLAFRKSALALGDI